MLSKTTTDTLLKAREDSPDIETALNEITDVIVGVMGTATAISYIGRPLNDTEEHKAINAALDAIDLAAKALNEVYNAVCG